MRGIGYIDRQITQKLNYTRADNIQAIDTLHTIQGTQHDTRTQHNTRHTSSLLASLSSKVLVNSKQ